MNMFCRICGSPLNEGDEFCSSCGHQVFKPAKPKMATSATNGSKTKPHSKASSLLESSKKLGFLREFLLHPKQWIPMGMLLVIWFILSMLVAQGINTRGVKIISFLTFAQAGMYGGIIGVIGGVIGKGIFAYFLSSIFMSFIAKKTPQMP